MNVKSMWLLSFMAKPLLMKLLLEPSTVGWKNMELGNGAAGVISGSGNSMTALTFRQRT